MTHLRQCAFGPPHNPHPMRSELRALAELWFVIVTGIGGVALLVFAVFG